MNPAPHKRSLAIELWLVSALILAVLWIPPVVLTPAQAGGWGWLKALMKFKESVYVWRPQEAVIFPIIGLFILFRLFQERRQSLSTGLDFKHPKTALRFWWNQLWSDYLPAIRQIAWPTLAGVAFLVALGGMMGSLDLANHRFWSKLYPNTFAGQFAQQAVIQLYFNHRATQIYGKGNRSVFWVTAYFTLLHLPNPALMAGTAYGMWFWARTYQKAPNILALTFSHCILSAFLWHCLPRAWHPSQTVGWRFLERVTW